MDSHFQQKSLNNKFLYLTTDGTYKEDQFNIVNNIGTTFILANLLYHNDDKCLISNDYDEIIVELLKHFNDIIYPCKFCDNKRGYKTIDKLNKHYKYFHKNI